MKADEVNKISEGIAILILSVIGFSVRQLSNAKQWLESIPPNVNRAIFLYVSGLIICEKKATSNKIANRVGYLSHDTLTRVLINGKRAIGKVTILLINFCLSQTTGYLIIDDVLVPKRYAEHIIGVYNEYDHAEHERVKGMRIVMVVWCNGRIRIPVAWAIWHKEKKIFRGYTSKGQPKYEHTGKCLLEIDGQEIDYRTKNQIAVELLDDVLGRGLRAQYITFDSWYASRDNLQRITQNRFAIPLQCYSRIKSNRKIIYQGEEMSVLALGRRLDSKSFNHKHGAYIKAEEVFLNGVGDIKLLFVRQDAHQEPGKNKYIFSTDLSASAPEILLRYRGRWAIETTFRDLKQNLNLGSCQARSLDAQESHLAMAIFAFVLLELLPDLTFGDKTARTIGEKKQMLSNLSLFTNCDRTKYWLMDSDKPGAEFVPLDEANLSKVELCFEFAYQSLVFPDCQRAT